MLYNLASGTDKEVIAKAPLSELNREIQRCRHGYETGGASQERKTSGSSSVRSAMRSLELIVSR